MAYGRRRNLNNHHKKTRARKSRKSGGGHGWSGTRKVLATFYGISFIGALFGIGFFLFGRSAPTVTPRPAAVAEAVVAPFAPVDLQEPPALAPPGKHKPDGPQVSRSGVRVVIVIDDMGPDVAEAKRAIGLDPNVTLSFLPYARDVRALAALAHASGHELLLHLPMEPVSPSENPGPHALLTELSAPELTKRLDWNLSRFTGYVGVNNHMGSHFTADRADMIPVMEALKARGLVFLDSRTTDATVGRRVAVQVGVPYAERDVFLDNEVDFGAVETQLEKVMAIARKHGLAIAIGHPHAVTLEKLAAWIPTLKRQGITLVPLSKVVIRPVTVAKAESGAF